MNAEEMSEETLAFLKESMKGFMFIDRDDLSSGHITKLVLKAFTRHTVHEEEEVVVEGEAGDWLFIVEIGELKVEIEDKLVKRIRRGAYFGELSLLYDVPRSATVTAMSDCVLWKLERTIFKQIQQIASRESMIQRCKRFRKVPEFSSLSPDHMLRLMKCLTPMTYGARNIIYAEGNVATKIMLIESGRISFSVPPSLLDLSNEERDEAMGIVRPDEDDVPLAVAHGADTCDIYPGCIIGLAVLRGRIGLESGWPWVDRHVETVHVVGADCPLTAIAMVLPLPPLLLDARTD